MLLYSQVDSRDRLGFFVLCGALFFLLPILGIIAAMFFAIKTDNKQLILFLIVLLVLYLSALNTTKVPKSDMVNYLEMFNSVPNNGFTNTLYYGTRGRGGAKDLGYTLLVYVLYHITFGNQYMFIFIVSAITFSFYFFSVYKFGVDNNLPVYLIVSELLVIAFFTQYFSLTFHLIRQELATSLFFYALTFRVSSIKKFIVWSVVASTMHSGIIVMIFFSFLPFMGQELSIKRIIVLICLALGFATLASKMGTFMLDNYELEGTAEYNVTRMAEMVGAQDRVQSTGLLYVFSAALLLFSSIEMIRNRGNVVYPLIVNLCFIWSVLVLGMSVSPLLQYRFYFMEFNFLPFVTFLLFRRNPKILKAVCFCVVIFFVVRFYAILNHVFYYVPIEEALCDPFFMLINI